MDLNPLPEEQFEREAELLAVLVPLAAAVVPQLFHEQYAKIERLLVSSNRPCNNRKLREHTKLVSA